MKLVKQYMTKDIFELGADSSLKMVIKVMKLHRMSIVPVVNKMGEYIGCISELNILSSAMPTYMKTIINVSVFANIDMISRQLELVLDHPASEFVDQKYPFVRPDDKIVYAIDLLFRTNRSIVPVIEDKILVGFFSRIDILTVSMADN